MYSFGAKSLSRLNECDEALQAIMFEAILVIDFSILEGHRSEEKQNEMFNTNRSKLNWPDSKHNSNPSEAIDIVPYPIIWPDPLAHPESWHKHLARFYYLAGIVKGIGSHMGIDLRWGGDWNGNNSFTDQNFDDLPHFELLK
jgi:peptidoglycan L-alanyl-D-glutamate endopeptidase CwlK